MKDKVIAFGKRGTHSYITQYGLDGSQTVIAPYPKQPYGSFTSTVSLNCAGNECYHWEEDTVIKFKVDFIRLIFLVHVTGFFLAWKMGLIIEQNIKYTITNICALLIQLLQEFHEILYRVNPLYQSFSKCNFYHSQLATIIHHSHPLDILH